LGVGVDAHRKLAPTAAHEAIALSKNENDLASLDMKKVKTITVIGPNQSATMLPELSLSFRTVCSKTQTIETLTNHPRLSMPLRAKVLRIPRSYRQ
jgi:beta-glucosidase-like glycosyl hydrolase